MGVVEDAPNRSKLAKLLRFKSLEHEDKYISFEDYVADMPEWQSDIYYIAGESIEGVKKSPFLEVAKKKGADVLYLVDPIDECKFMLITRICVVVFVAGRALDSVIFLTVQFWY
jgi:HSP90 family molecular chaperone